MQGILFIEGLYHLTKKAVKTETRRTGALDGLVNNNPDDWKLLNEGPIIGDAIFENKQYGLTQPVKPRYKAGETIYLKEPYKINPDGTVCYMFDFEPDGAIRTITKFSNKMFMPVKFARQFIKINSVHCERIQVILKNEKDAINEGIIKLPDINNVFQGYTHCLTNVTRTFPLASHAYKDLFIKINKKSGAKSWHNNDWVFIYKYELTNKPDNL